MNRLGLGQFGLLQNQTIASLVKAVPSLEPLPLNQVQPIANLVGRTTGNLALGSQSLAAITRNDLLGKLSLQNLDLSKYSFTQLPGIADVPLQQFPGWQASSIAAVPGLS